MAHRRWWLNFSCKFRCSFLSMQISTAVVFTDRFCISAPKHSLVGQTVIKVEKTKKKRRLKTLMAYRAPAHRHQQSRLRNDRRCRWWYRCRRHRHRVPLATEPEKKQIKKHDQREIYGDNKKKTIMEIERRKTTVGEWLISAGHRTC